jgi:hypothetical protein
MSYCNIGDTARVTFPGGAVQDYSDTPITITCDDNRPCQLPSNQVIYLFRLRGKTRAFGNGDYSQFVDWEQLVETPSYMNAYDTYQGYRIDTREISTWNKYANRTYLTGTVKGFRLWVKHTRQFNNCTIFENDYGETPPYDSLTSVELVSIRNKFAPTTLYPPLKLIKITGNSGAILHEGNYENCNYSVECIEGCPEGTLDCGDCCLPCDEIFNSISDIRALVSRLR